MESGIYRDLETTSDLVVFGGRIGSVVHFNSEDKRVAELEFFTLSNNVGVGGKVETEEYSTAKKPSVKMVFNNTESIDIVIECLKFIKDIIGGALPNDELFKKHSEFKPIKTQE